MRKWGFPASFLAHALLLLAFTIPLSLRDAPPQQESVPVEIWTNEELGELAGRATPQAAQEISPDPSSESALIAKPDATTSTEPTPPPSQPITTVIRATKMLSGDVLSHPASRKMRQMLPLLEMETRLEQLCNIEAMAQIAAALKQFEPDRVVAYAMADTKRDRNTLTAQGAAFRSGSSWYNLSYKCQLDTVRQVVKGFELTVGDAIPKGLWEDHNLPLPELDRD